MVTDIVRLVTNTLAMGNRNIMMSWLFLDNTSFLNISRLSLFNRVIVLNIEATESIMIRFGLMCREIGITLFLEI